MSRAREKLPFALWLRRAVTVFGLPPSEFWALSLAEWRWLNAGDGAAPMNRREFAALSTLYPDDRS